MWKYQDLALCIKSFKTIEGRQSPRKGQIFTVEKAKPEPFVIKEGTTVWLQALWLLDGPMNIHSNGSQNSVWVARHFVKIPSLTKEEREQFLADLDIEELV